MRYGPPLALADTCVVPCGQGGDVHALTLTWLDACTSRF